MIVLNSHVEVVYKRREIALKRERLELDILQHHFMMYPRALSIMPSSTGRCGKKPSDECFSTLGVIIQLMENGELKI